MENITELKCACNSCGTVIDYRADAAGQVIECPACKEKSRLPEASSIKLAPKDELPPVAPPRLCSACGENMAPYGSACETCEANRRRTLGLIIGLVSAIAVLAVGWMFLKRYYTTTAAPVRPASGSHMILEQPRVKAPKSPKDLRVGTFWLETKRGSDLVMAVGDIQNVSLNVYLHVKVDVDILDAKGAKIGAATETINELLPDKTWRFISTVKDPRAKSVRFAGLKEIQ